jgi:hypothetical protein
MTLSSLRLHALGQIQDLVITVDPRKDAFLFYLPRLLAQPEFLRIDGVKALTFTKLALNHERPPLISAALLVLNQIISPEDGSFAPPVPMFFYNNRSFLWKELGNHTDAVHVITHILNKTFFVLSLGK